MTLYVTSLYYLIKCLTLTKANLSSCQMCNVVVEKKAVRHKLS